MRKSTNHLCGRHPHEKGVLQRPRGLSAWFVVGGVDVRESFMRQQKRNEER